MPAREDFQYAIVRVVPHVERGECLNAGVVLFCRRLGFLGARTELDEAALAAVAPDCEPEDVRAHLEHAGARGGRRARTAGRSPRCEPSERFHWLTAPSSTIVQSSAVHTGLTSDPAGELEHLFERLVSR